MQASDPDGTAGARPDTLTALDRFEARSDASGLFLRYARGRLRAFAARQVMTVAGALALWLLVDPLTALAALLAGFLGDAADCLFLRHLLRRFAGARVPPRWRRIATLAAAAQAATISGCIALAWLRGGGTVGIEFFASAFLFGALIDAGLARPHAPALADARIALYVGTLGGLLLQDALRAPGGGAWLQDQAAFLIATVMLGYAAVQFVTHVGRSFARNLAFERDLLREQHQLSLSREALAQGEARARRLALVAENANDSILIYDADGRIDWVNETFTRLIGYRLDEVRGRVPGDVLNADGTDPEAIRSIVESRAEGRPCRTEILNRTRDGRTLWLEVSSTPVRDADGRLAMTISVERDITEAKARAADLAEARLRAEAAAEAKSRFLATMSHEIRTPMNGVIGMAELLSATPLSPVQRDYVSAIRDSGQALLTLINDILDLSRLQAGRMTIAADPFDLAALMRGVGMLLAPLAEGKAVTFRNLPPGHPPVWVTGDAGRVRQVLVNLVGNAIKFTRAGEVALHLGAEDRDGLLALTAGVADTGIGIAPDRLEAVFDSFTQADGTISREFGGTGLGLSLSRLLAREMGGDVQVASVPGQGSVFTLDLTLPRAAAPAEAVAAPVAPLPRLHGRHVLVAEDNRTNRLILRRLLEPLAVRLTEAANGAEAVAAARDDPPDVILMDMQMPVMDGLTAIRAIRAEEAARQRPPCPILMLTANAFAEDREACRAAGCDDFLTKPVQRDTLYDRIVRLLPPADTAGDGVAA